jgi:PmbA protein
MKEKKVGLTVTNGEISAVLRSNTQKTGIRIYDNDCIGIAGAIGAYDDGELTQRAKKMLDFKVPYDASPTENARREVDLSGELGVSDTEFVETSRKLLRVLNEKYPKFMFSNKINLIEKEDSLVNDAGTSLRQKDRYVDFGLLIKYRDSKNLMDGFGSYDARNLDFDQLLKTVSRDCEIYEQKADFGEAGEKIPVVFLGRMFMIMMKFYMDLNGDAFANGASLFSGKTGEKLFHEDFSLLVNRDPKTTFARFFDGEGVVLPNDRFALIENGVIKAPYTSKRTAKRYGLPVTGTANMEYDSAPAASPYEMGIARGGKTLKELLGGRKAIYVASASGGDFTPQGEYASPIQGAYLFDGENYFGRLPQLSMTSHINDIFGKDFIGVSSDGNYPGSPNQYLVVDMTVKKIDGWL